MTIVQYAIVREFGRLSRLKRDLKPDEEVVYRKCEEVARRLQEQKRVG